MTRIFLYRQGSADDLVHGESEARFLENGDDRFGEPWNCFEEQLLKGNLRYVLRNLLVGDAAYAIKNKHPKRNILGRKAVNQSTVVAATAVNQSNAVNSRFFNISEIISKTYSIFPTSISFDFGLGDPLPSLVIKYRNWLLCDVIIT